MTDNTLHILETPVPASMRDIQAPVQDDLKDFEREMRVRMSARVRMLNVVCRYLLWQKGKRMRPVLVLLAAGAAGRINHNVHRAAVSIELLHTATLVHDDVVDRADTRRSLPSVNWLWYNKIAVLAGDYLLAQSLRAALDIRDFRVLDILSETTRRMSEGEILQVQKRKDLKIDESAYLEIISNKTAALFAAGCELGGFLAQGADQHCRVLREYGECLGMAFQIQDDLFDYTGSIALIGKPMGINTKNNPISLPLIHALRTAPEGERRPIERLLRAGGARGDQRKLVQFCRQFGGLEYAAQKAQEYVEKARRCLDLLEPSPYVRSLHGFLQLVVNRKK